MNRLQEIAAKKQNDAKRAQTNALFCEVQPTLERHYMNVIREVFAAINAGHLTNAAQVYAYAESIS